MSDTYDAVVIGAGPNGLVAANLLLDAGWRVLILEAQPRVGGAVASDEDVAPGYIHDTFSSFYPLSAASPIIRGLGLEKYGLTWAHAPSVVGTPDSDGRWALVHHDARETAACLDELSPGDGDAWLQLADEWQIIGPSVIEALLSPFPPVKGGARVAWNLRKLGGLAFVRKLLEPSRHLTEHRFRNPATRLLIAGNAAHADLHPDAAGSGLFGWLLAMLGQDVGFPVPRGGAGRLAAALADRFRAGGGVIRCECPVVEVLVEHRRAVGVRTADGEIVRSGRAVIADVNAERLYGGLVPWRELPDRVRRQMSDFSRDPATVKVDWALTGPVPWAVTPEKAPGTVHLAASVGELSEWMTQIRSDLIPTNPFLLIGQMTAADPTRSPAGTEALWAYTHVPQRVVGDAGAGHGSHTAASGEITGVWDDADAQRMADRMQARIELAAPGFSSLIAARRILTPPDLERRDANLVGGSINGGTSDLHQELVFRPIPGTGRATTPIKGLYLGSASAHPGGGVHGACGSNAARAALAHARFSLRR